MRAYVHVCVFVVCVYDNDDSAGDISGDDYGLEDDSYDNNDDGDDKNTNDRNDNENNKMVMYIHIPG